VLIAAMVCTAIALNKPIRRRFRFFARTNFQPQLLGPFLRIGWPPAVQSAGVILAMLVFFFVLGRISTLAVAAGNIVLRIASLSLMPGIGIGVAIQTMVGQALGARRSREAVRIGWSGVVVAAAVLGTAGTAFALAPGFLLRLFSPDPDLVQTGTPILRLTGLMQIAAAVGAPLSGALRGAGETRVVMLVDIVAGCGLVPVCAWIFGIVLGGGLFGSWLALVLWFTLYALGMVLLFLRGGWRRAEV
jgi:Na+-driven multidrug efflux pump